MTAVSPFILSVTAARCASLNTVMANLSRTGTPR
jgi:hypothetical protein